MNVRHIPSTYDDADVDIGIVHLGLGAFHRAHQAVFIEQHLSRTNGGPWGVAAANLRSNKTIVESMEKAGCAYHVAEYASREDVVLREVLAIRQALFAGDDSSALLDLMLRPEVRIVTLTVSEKGHYIGTDGQLLADDPAIVRDLEQPLLPKTPVGVLARALEKRKQAGIAPFAVLSCDNLPENGRRVKNVVTAFAALRDDALAAWIERNTPFPCSMVDRLVPSMNDESFANVAGLLGKHDPNAVVCEDFKQWVVEDFGSGRPDWEEDGVYMTSDVRPYEYMKLRQLNGSHSLLAYLGGMAGKEIILDCMREPLLAELVKRYLATEAGPSLSGVPEDVWQSNSAAILRRFSNDSLAHKTNQIAMDGSQKIPQRWLNGTLIRLEQGAPCPCTALGLAGWVYHMRERDENGQAFPMRDPWRESLLADLLPLLEQPEACIKALFARADLFPPTLAANSAYVQQVQTMYSLIRERGVLAAMQATLNS